MDNLNKSKIINKFRFIYIVINLRMNLMIDLKTNIAKRMMIFALIILAGIITLFIDSLTYPLIIFIAPGLLFGIALTLPHYDKSKKQNIAITTLPLFMILLCNFSLVFGLFLGLINNSYSDKTGVVILGAVSSFLFLIVLEKYYPIQNRKTTYFIIIILGVLSTLIGDTLFLLPRSKELNFGKMISIWEFLIGLGLTVFTKFEYMKGKTN